MHQDSPGEFQNEEVKIDDNIFGESAYVKSSSESSKESSESDSEDEEKSMEFPLEEN